MNPNLYNSEGYFDPTPYEAIKRIEGVSKQPRQYMPLVYICSPFSGNVAENIRAARRYSRFALEKGCIPIAPHLLFPQFMNDSDPEERDLAIGMDLILLSKCSELWMFGSTVSSGMGIELAYAKRKSKLIRNFDTDCKEVHK